MLHNKQKNREITRTGRGSCHNVARTCQIENDKSEDVLKEFIATITNDG